MLAATHCKTKPWKGTKALAEKKITQIKIETQRFGDQTGCYLDFVLVSSFYKIVNVFIKQ